MPPVFDILTASGRFCAQKSGPEPRAVFLHGFSGDLHTWDGLWDVVGGALPSLRYDQRGFGNSSPLDDRAYDHADDLLAILDAMGIVCCDLVGVSQGGALAVNFALNHPQRVRRLVLISPGLVAWNWSDAWRALWKPIVRLARAGDLEPARHLWWQHPLFDSTRASAAGPAVQAAIQRYSGQQWLLDPHRHLLPDVERLHQLDKPCLLLTGGQDLEEFHRIADVIQARVPQVQRIDHALLGHLLHAEDPRRCAAQILEFLGR